MAIGEEYVEAFRTWKVPTCTKEVEQFLGFVNYHRNFIKGYSAIAKPLTLITGKKPFEWGQEQQKAYDTLKSALQTTPVLTLPNSTDKFILDTDASNNAIGAELLQVQDGQERVVAYGSFTLSAAQRRYCTTRKELLAVVRFTQHFRHYLLGREFLVRTDHSSLQWLMNFKEPQGQLARWLEVLSQYHMQIQHPSGKKHVNADVLSRLDDNGPCKEMSIFNPPSSLPCGGCKYCVKVHEKWQDFMKIDNVIPLAEKKNRGITEEADQNFTVVQEIVIHVPNATNTETIKTEEVVSINSVATSYGIQYTTDQLSAEQAKDKDLHLVLHWLKNQEEPAETDLFLADQAAKKYHINREQFFLDSDGVLRNRSKNNLTSNSRTDWDEYLPQLAGAIRLSVNRMTGLTPNMMMYGREVNMPADLVFQSPASDTTTYEAEYVCKLKESIIRAHEIARQKLKTSHSYMKRDYDVRIRQVEYKPGDLVYILNMANPKGKSKKLESPWKGPGVVLAKITSYVYKVQLEKMITVINHYRMKRCCDLETPTWVKKKQKEVIDGVPANLDTGDLEIFCFCRKGDNGSFMIQCDRCDEWYHDDCVGVNAELADKWTEYFCPACQRKRKKTQKAVY
ncbi:uncharacterized protein LOC128180527 [Crassostrea angulata]|uniref:uncharacterized protein LOC128180527 n=1 Tax=Magallana angulata TaxID=2784310 RepID=UPI0022B1F46A|nr:uncharacterized protein LOC128180527 [Crassostrea angulata]